MYPNLLRRIGATLIDIAVIWLVVSFIIQRPLFVEPQAANYWASVVFILLYEPVLTTYLCTVGQALMATRIRHFETLERITISKAYLRFLLKYVASVIGAAASRGMVRVWARGDLRALHDLQAETVVINASAARRAQSE